MESYSLCSRVRVMSIFKLWPSTDVLVSNTTAQINVLLSATISWETIDHWWQKLLQSVGHVDFTHADLYHTRGHGTPAID